MTNLENILKSRDITLPTKVCIVKAMVFPVVKYGYESESVSCLVMSDSAIPWTQEPGRLQSMGSQKVGHD